jgi:hypothetical protein
MARVSDIREPEWPLTGRALDPDQVADVLAEFDRWHPIAVEQLAETAERIEHEASTFGDAARGVRVWLRADGSRREEPWEGA